MAGRATQIDGLRAFSMLGVACVHWIPREARFHLPFELGLFFFLVLTGYLITGVLLRERDRGEESGLPWRASGLKNFQIRRGLRILAPYYAGVALAWCLGAKDVREALPWYLFHVSNIHLALHGWVDFTSHFWSLAAQQQFYVVWPFVIWWVPKRWLAPVLVLFTAIAPVFRTMSWRLAEDFVVPDLLPASACDYFGLGGLLALAVHRGMKLDHPGLARAGWAAFAGYVALYAMGEAGHPVPWVHALQQTLLSVAMCALIAGASTGFSGWRGALLDHRAVQCVGKLSYGLYIYHNLAPLVCGWAFPWLWKGAFLAGPGLLLRLVVIGFLTWLLAWLSWRFIEVPTQRVKARVSTPV